MEQKRKLLLYGLTLQISLNVQSEMSFHSEKNPTQVHMFFVILLVRLGGEGWGFFVFGFLVCVCFMFMHFVVSFYCFILENI